MRCQRTQVMRWIYLQTKRTLQTGACICVTRANFSDAANVVFPVEEAAMRAQCAVPSAVSCDSWSICPASSAPDRRAAQVSVEPQR